MRSPYHLGAYREQQGVAPNGGVLAGWLIPPELGCNVWFAKCFKTTAPHDGGR